MQLAAQRYICMYAGSNFHAVYSLTRVRNPQTKRAATIRLAETGTGILGLTSFFNSRSTDVPQAGSRRIRSLTVALPNYSKSLRLQFSNLQGDEHQANFTKNETAQQHDSLLLSELVQSKQTRCTCCPYWLCKCKQEVLVRTIFQTEVSCSRCPACSSHKLTTSNRFIPTRRLLSATKNRYFKAGEKAGLGCPHDILSQYLSLVSLTSRHQARPPHIHSILWSTAYEQLVHNVDFTAEMSAPNLIRRWRGSDSFPVGAERHAHNKVNSSLPCKCNRNRTYCYYASKRNCRVLLFPTRESNTH